MSIQGQKNVELFERLRSIALPVGSFVIFGSGPMAIRGLKEAHDLDVVVTQDVYDTYRAKEGWTEETGDIDTYLQNNGIELWHNWKPGTWDVNELITNAEIIDGLPFVPLTQVLKWKEANARPKDIEDAELIRAHIAAQ